MFTDFTSANIGTPQNYALPFLYENHPDQFGYVANASGINYLDLGVGLHSYGFMDRAFSTLMTFIASQLVVMALGMLPLKH